MATSTKTKTEAGTAEKLGPKQKRCCGCDTVKNRFKAFKPRWGRCSKHKEAGKPFQAKCKGCVEAINSNIRQPRCVECDAARTKKVAAAKPKKGKKGKKGTTVQVPSVEPTTVVVPPPAPVVEPTVVVAPAPVPEPVVVGAPTDALSAVSALLAEPASGVPATDLPF